MRTDTEARLSLLLGTALVAGRGMNDFVHRFLEAVESVLGFPRAVLYDYDERAGTFDLLCFHGHPPDARPTLGRRIREIDPRRALEHRDPYPVDETGASWVVPLYFQDTLEALLHLECPGSTWILDDDRRAGCRLLSRFLGLFMSSVRLPVNRRGAIRRTSREQAREVQLSYLPSAQPESERYEIYGYNQSSALVGGDYFDYFCPRDDTLQFVIADACGHGMQAALTICAFRDMLHEEARRRRDLSGLFDELNSRLYERTDQLQYLTGLFFDYDEGQRELRYFNAGHYPPLLVPRCGVHRWLPEGGLPLGMFETARYEVGSCRVEPGDLIVLFTDGIVDLANACEDFFGVESIVRAVMQRRQLKPRALAHELLGEAARFCEGAEPNDDLTLFLMRFE